jgi:two-component system response regulator AlgR
LQQALNRAKALSRVNISELRDNTDSNSSRSHLSTTIQGNLQIVPIEKIYYLKADQKYVTAVWSEGELLLDDSLKSLEQEFTSQFMRIHRNTLVALEHILGLEKDEEGNLTIRMRGIETRLPVSRRHTSHVRKMLKNL